MESYDLHSESDSEYVGRRKGRKVLAEKRRRARINQCLKDIKNIVCEAQKQDPNYEKMEKAEILETTVDYLRNVRKINTTHQQVKETLQVRFQQGFSRCAEEILTYIQSLPGVSDNVQHQLRKHLSGRLTHIQQVPVTSSTQSVTSYQGQCHNRLASVSSRNQGQCAHANISMSVRTSPVFEENSSEDSGFSSSPYPSRHSLIYEKTRCAIDSELYKTNSVFTECRVSAWVQSTLYYSEQNRKEQQGLWRPW